MVFYVVFSGNDYQNENQMSRDCGNIEQMDQNVTLSSNNRQTLNSESNAASNVAALKPTIPTTIDGLIEYIAKNGDYYETKIIEEIAQMNERSLFR